MTAPGRITQDDMNRAAKSVKAGGFERARIVYDLANARIEVIIGEPLPDSAEDNPWSED